ncbi:MAG: hypothetical protein JWM68_2034 [Verrucomicrobiales bacterium]|nr:hypothetical protein [Verrucomicrobiales bacterium]
MFSFLKRLFEKKSIEQFSADDESEVRENPLRALRP